MKNIIKLGIVACTALVFVNGCKAKKTPTQIAEIKPKSVCDLMTVGYASHVKSIIDKECASGCHSAKNAAGGLDLTTYENVMYEAGKPRFLGALNHEAPFSPMPKKHPKLADSTIQVITCWIENGRAL